MQIVFGRDAILNINHISDWDTFDNANKNEVIVLTSAKICAVITTNTKLVTKF